ncbi:uncharacterized protein Tco_0323040 [Tanacetum coccineum]
MSSRKHNLRNKSALLSDIPILDFDVAEDDDVEIDLRNSFVGVSEEYLDHGDPTHICGSTSKTYNMMFSFTSMGGKVDHSVNIGPGPYCFRLHGQNYHRLGSLLPVNDAKPKFSQLYVYDTDNEDQNRIDAIRSGSSSRKSSGDSIDPHITQALRTILDENNELVKSYRMVRDRYRSQENQLDNVKLKLVGRRTSDGRTYNLPTASEIAVLIVGDIEQALDERDIVVESRNGDIQQINVLHPKFLSLQYPLLFPYGEDGYHTEILHRDVVDPNTKQHVRLTMREFMAYIIQERPDKFSLIHNSRRLFQQFLVDIFTMIETERMYFFRKKQKLLRCASYENLSNQLKNGNRDASKLGKSIFLPSSFTVGARFMRQNYLDAMTLCKWFGHPDFFITFTCNPKWPEISRFVRKRGLKPEDRPEVLCRMFKFKLDHLIKNLKDNQIFGRVQAVVYTIEFQKRGLPHSHTCLFLHKDDKLLNPERIDDFISAEIPDKDLDPDLYTLVTEHMMHGPCRADNPSCPCTIKGVCTKFFPKKYSNHTTNDSAGYPVYRRREDGKFVENNHVRLNNGFVVPYNSYLLKKYQAHINVEWCNQAGSIKYLFKYINKGLNRVTSKIQVGDRDNEAPSNDEVVDEIKDYYDCRYLSACESSWRILKYEVVYRTPAVERLPFHLPGQQQVVYDEDDDIDDVLNKPSVASTKFLAWMDINKTNDLAKTLTYAEFPTKFVWIAQKRIWQERKRGYAVGRIHNVPRSVGDAYYLRVLLNKVKGPTSWDKLYEYDDIIHPSFRDACFARGLLDDDREYILGLEEIHGWELGNKVRLSFVHLLMSNSMSRPDHVWNETWKFMKDDIEHRQRQLLNNPDLEMRERHIKNLILQDIDAILRKNGSCLSNIASMPLPDLEFLQNHANTLIHDELCYNKDELRMEHENLFSSLTTEQQSVYGKVISAVENNKGGVFFLYGYGGTGKTYIWRTLSAAIRCKGDIVLNVASSGIASLLLPGGRTAHSRFGIPINVDETSVCSITHGSDLAALLGKTKLIIWDEAPMMNKHCFEALDRTLRDILRVSNIPFGGKVIVFGGDFRQILPVITGGTRQDIVNASLNSSYLWDHINVLRLTKNMRLKNGSGSSNTDDIKEFADWILKVGDGRLGGPNDGEAMIDIPDDILIKDCADPIGALVSFVYPSILSNLNNTTYFQERAILAPTHEVVEFINDHLLSLLPGKEKVYLSSDSICESEGLNDNFNESLYSPDVLNGMKLAGLPNHRLVLKVGAPVMLLRNIDQSEGLCNGTRLRIKELGDRAIKVEILTGTNVGQQCH